MERDKLVAQRIIFYISDFSYDSFSSATNFTNLKMGLSILRVREELMG